MTEALYRHHPTSFLTELVNRYLWKHWSFYCGLPAGAWRVVPKMSHHQNHKPFGVKSIFCLCGVLWRFYGKKLLVMFFKTYLVSLKGQCLGSRLCKSMKKSSFFKLRLRSRRVNPWIRAFIIHLGYLSALLFPFFKMSLSMIILNSHGMYVTKIVLIFLRSAFFVSRMHI